MVIVMVVHESEDRYLKGVVMMSIDIVWPGKGKDCSVD